VFGAVGLPSISRETVQTRNFRRFTMLGSISSGSSQRQPAVKYSESQRKSHDIHTENVLPPVGRGGGSDTSSTMFFFYAISCFLNSFIEGMNCCSGMNCPRQFR
jgi:hypothetical protein